MSRSGRAAGASRRAADEPDNEICPVCRSTSYLNPDLKFQINPGCYHRLCDNCVIRYFGDMKGNGICPVPGCAKTLSKTKFRRATFEDLKVEREMDLRKDVMKVMNKKEGDFETLRDYNDYLEQVEELAWNLILNIDVDATRKKLDRFEQQQKAEASAGAGAGATNRKPQITVRATLNKGVVQAKPDDADNDIVFHGLKKRVAPPKEAPFDPWGGYNIAPQYYVLQNNYDVDWYARMKTDPAHRVGGHSLQDYCSRALREAFGGFGVFIEDEIAARDVVSGDADVGTEHAALAAVSGNDANMDDIF